MVGDLYQISFPSQDIDLAMTLQSLVSTQHLECNIHYDGECIKIRIPRNPEYFYYTAEFIKEIDDYRIKYS